MNLPIAKPRLVHIAVVDTTPAAEVLLRMLREGITGRPPDAVILYSIYEEPEVYEAAAAKFRALGADPIIVHSTRELVRACREIARTPKNRPLRCDVHVYYPTTTDHVNRAEIIQRDGARKLFTNHFPLIERGMSDLACRLWLEARPRA